MLSLLVSSSSKTAAATLRRMGQPGSLARLASPRSFATKTRPVRKVVLEGGVDVQTALATLREHALKKLRNKKGAGDTEANNADAQTTSSDSEQAALWQSVDVAVHLNIDVRKSDQNVRGSVALPHGSGREVRVAVFAKGDKAEEAEGAGADVVGAEDLADRIQEGWLEFDRCLATPDMMPQVAKVARILGPKGLMPNPKLGTLTMDVAGAVGNAKRGQALYRAERSGIIHASVGRLSMSDQQLMDNLKALQMALLDARPKSAPKGVYFKKCTMSTTQGPGVQVDKDRVNPASKYFMLKQ